MRSLRDEANRMDSILRASIDQSFNNTGQSDDSYGLYLARKVDFSELQEAAKQYFYLDIPLRYRITPKEQGAKDFEKRLHPMHGALFTFNQSPATLAALDEKPMEGFIDSAFFKKKGTLEVRDSFINSSLILDERPVVPFRTFVPKLLCDHNLVAFAAKGNQSPHQEIAVDFSVFFNIGMRITILAEGEGPFAPQVPAIDLDEQLLCDKAGIHLPRKAAVERVWLCRPWPSDEVESGRASQRADQQRPDTTLRRDFDRRGRYA